MQSNMVNFRADDALVEALESAAQREGVSVSEVIRRAIMANVVDQREVISDACAMLASTLFVPSEGETESAFEAIRNGQPFYSPGEGSDPAELLPLAAHGDLTAQRELAEMSLYLAMADYENNDPLIVLHEGLMFARMASSHGNADDEMRVIVMLGLASLVSTGCASREHAAEALARRDLFSSTGVKGIKEISRLLTGGAIYEQPETLELAKRYNARLSAAMDTVH